MSIIIPPSYLDESCDLCGCTAGRPSPGCGCGCHGHGGHGHHHCDCGTGGYGDWPPPLPSPPPNRPHFEPSPTCPAGAVCARPIERCNVACKPFYDPQRDQWGKSCITACPGGQVSTSIKYGSDPYNPWG